MSNTYIFTGQSALRIQVNTGIDLSSAEVCNIKYTKPDGTDGEWLAQISNETEGIIYYDVESTSILDQAGEWTIWAYITFLDSTVAIGKSDSFVVYEEGT